MDYVAVIFVCFIFLFFVGWSIWLIHLLITDPRKLLDLIKERLSSESDSGNEDF